MTMFIQKIYFAENIEKHKEYQCFGLFQQTQGSPKMAPSPAKMTQNRSKMAPRPAKTTP
jgi:hypothetical protein